MDSVVNVNVTHPDPHRYDVVGWKLAFSNYDQGRWTLIEPVFDYDRSAIPIGSPETGVVIDLVIDVNYGQQLDRFIRCHAVDSQGILSEPSSVIPISILETFTAPVISVV